MNKKNIIIAAVSLVIVIAIFLLIAPRQEGNILTGRVTGEARDSVIVTVSYGQNQLLHTGHSILERLIVGKDVASSAIQIYDASSATDQTDPVVYFSGSTLQGIYELGITIDDGVMVNVSAQTNGILVITPK